MVKLHEQGIAVTCKATVVGALKKTRDVTIYYIRPSKESYVGALGGLGYVHQTPRNSLNINS